MQWFIEPPMTAARAEDANPSRIQEQGTLICWGVWHNHPQIVLQGKGSPYKLGKENSMSGYVNANKLSLVGAEKTNIRQSQQDPPRALPANLCRWWLRLLRQRVVKVRAFIYAQLRATSSSFCF